MKHIKYVILLTILSITLFSCDKTKQIKPDITDIREICNFAVLECYYHNNAEVIKQASLGKKETKQWIDYGSIIKIGIDVSLVKIDIQNNEVFITIPNPTILNEPEIDENSIEIITEYGIFMQTITDNDQLYAMNEANKNAKETIEKNKRLILNAENRVKKLLQTYIKQIGELTNTEYKISWLTYENITDDKK